MHITHRMPLCVPSRVPSRGAGGLVLTRSTGGFGANEAHGMGWRYRGAGGGGGGLVLSRRTGVGVGGLALTRRTGRGGLALLRRTGGGGGEVWR